MVQLSVKISKICWNDDGPLADAHNTEWFWIRPLYIRSIYGGLLLSSLFTGDSINFLKLFAGYEIGWICNGRFPEHELRCVVDGIICYNRFKSW